MVEVTDYYEYDHDYDHDEGDEDDLSRNTNQILPDEKKIVYEKGKPHNHKNKKHRAQRNKHKHRKVHDSIKSYPTSGLVGNATQSKSTKLNVAGLLPASLLLMFIFNH